MAPQAQQLAASPRCIVRQPVDTENKEGWKRLQAMAPYCQPHQVTAAAGDYGKDNPWVGASYP